MEVRNRMESAKEIVEKNAKAAQTKKKAYYSQKKWKMNLLPGDKVLLLLPSSTKKLVALWQGPYQSQVVRCTGN